MPLVLSKNLPAFGLLRSEGLTVAAEAPKGVNCKRVLFLNLMPEKQESELDAFRAMYDEEIWVEFHLIKMSNLRYKTTPQAYMDAYYEDVALVMERGENYDGLFINGAPLQDFKFNEVLFWEQLQVFFRWSDRHVGHCLYVCWGAFARTFFDWGVQYKHHTVQWSGVYPCRVTTHGTGLTDDSCDTVLSPVSRPIYFTTEQLQQVGDCVIVLDNDEVGPSLYMSRDGRHVFSLNHPEYGPGRLDFEYRRDLSRDKNPMRPVGYYTSEDSEDDYRFTWLDTRRYLYGGWLKML